MIRHLLSITCVFVLAISFVGNAVGFECRDCHSPIVKAWGTSPHAATQDDVARELAAKWAGQPADSVLFGSHGEDCVACHGPRSVNLGLGLTELQAMNHYFSTSAGLYTSRTVSADTANWSGVDCRSCHMVANGHSEGPAPSLAIFNSTTGKYAEISTVSALCGQCHGSLRFSTSNHKLYDSWKHSRHGRQGQNDLATELATRWAGKSADDVIDGPDGENCIACHAPTAVKLGDGLTEAQALSHYFTSANGVFTESTTLIDTARWPGVGCTACHDPHQPQIPAYFNSSTGRYQAVSPTNELCGQCHGTLRFPSANHRTYDLSTGAGGVGVQDELMMPGVTCVDCHMHRENDGGSSSAVSGSHSWDVFTSEADGTLSASCAQLRCHPGFTAQTAHAIVNSWRAEYADLLAKARERVAFADSALRNVADPVRLAQLREADSNLAFAASDEGAGVHNFTYLKALLDDAASKAGIALAADGVSLTVPARFELAQNFPNPFNPSTQIEFDLPRRARINLAVYNSLGQLVRTLIDGERSAGPNTITWDGTDTHGLPMASGVFFYRLVAGDLRTTRKMVLLR